MAAPVNPASGERGVEDAVGSELVDEPIGDAEDAPSFDILAEENDPVIGAHDLAVGALDGFGDGCLRHGRLGVGWAVESA